MDHLQPSGRSRASGQAAGPRHSPGSYNGKVGLAVFCPITSRVKGYPFEVSIPAGLEVSGVVLSDQVKSLDWRARNAEFLCRLPRGATVAVLERLGTRCSGPSARDARAPAADRGR